MFKNWLSDWRNPTLVVLAAMLLFVGYTALSETRPADDNDVDIDPALQTVSMLQTVFDQAGRNYVDLVFDTPLGQDQQGKRVDPSVGRWTPEIDGSWRWYGANVLRFEAVTSFRPASRYQLQLTLASRLDHTQAYVGESEIEIVTSLFRVESLKLNEEPAVNNQVVLRGTFRFNYPVSPERLLEHLVITDPAKGGGSPIPLSLETGYRNNTLRFRTAPVAKLRQERRLSLKLAAALPSTDPTVTLPKDFTQPIPIGSREGLYWYQDGQLIGTGPPDQPQFTHLQVGAHELVVVDNRGRSDRLRYQVLRPHDTPPALADPIRRNISKQQITSRGRRAAGPGPGALRPSWRGRHAPRP